MFRSIIEAGTGWGVALGVIAAVNSVIAFFYYFGVVRQMWFAEPAEGDRSPIRVPPALAGAIAPDGRGRAWSSACTRSCSHRIGERAF